MLRTYSTIGLAPMLAVHAVTLACGSMNKIIGIIKKVISISLKFDVEMIEARASQDTKQRSSASYGAEVTRPDMWRTFILLSVYFISTRSCCKLVELLCPPISAGE
jgi:hypothetical protein